MKLKTLPIALALGVAACSSTPEAGPSTQVPTSPTGSIASASATPSASAAALTPEEIKKKADDEREFAEARAAFEKEKKDEDPRWTAALHAEAKALADKKYPDGKSAIKAAMGGKHRQLGHSDRDAFRHPLETFDFLGLKPNMTVLEYGPGEGWVTELLAPTLASQGKLFSTTADPNGPPDQRSTFNATRFRALLDRGPEVYGKIETVVIDNKKPSLPMKGTLDMVVLFRGVHGMQNNKVLDGWLKAFHDALKPDGVLGIEQHRAKEGDDVAVTSKKGYIPEKWLIEQVEKAGFKLAGKSEINANPKDTKDYEEGVWTLPPTYRLKDKDRDKYKAIGESDRMTLKFVKTN
jgi:predicted methyltransferase